MVVFGIAFVFLFKKYYATYNGRRVVDRMVLKLPVLGILMRKRWAHRWPRRRGGARPRTSRSRPSSSLPRGYA